MPATPALPRRPDDPGDADALWAGLLALPPAVRAVLVLRYADGQGDDAIAAMVRRDPAVVARTGQRGLISLGVTEDLTARSPDETATALRTVLAGRGEEVRAAVSRSEPLSDSGIGGGIGGGIGRDACGGFTGGSTRGFHEDVEPDTGRDAGGRSPLRQAVRSLAWRVAVVVVVFAATMAFILTDPDRTQTPAETPARGVVAGAVPVSTFDAIAGRWRLVRFDGAAVPEPPAVPAAYLEFSRYGHWFGTDGCGTELVGYFSLTDRGQVASTRQVRAIDTGSESRPGCRQDAVPSDAIYSDDRVLSLEGEVLVARRDDGREVAALTRIGARVDSPTVDDLTAIEGVWKHSGLRGDLNSLGDALPLRDLLTIEDAAAETARWSDGTGGCRVVGGELVLDDSGYAGFLRTFSTESSCSGSTGRLPDQLEQTIGLVLESRTVLLLIDERGREVSRLTRVTGEKAD